MYESREIGGPKNLITSRINKAHHMTLIEPYGVLVWIDLKPLTRLPLSLLQEGTLLRL